MHIHGKLHSHAVVELYGFVCRLYGCNVCGEGGEYETLVLDCPLFRHARISLDEWSIQRMSGGSLGAVAVLQPQKYSLQPKVSPQLQSGATEQVSNGLAAACIAGSESAAWAGESEATAEDGLVIWVPDDYQAPTAPLQQLQAGNSEATAENATTELHGRDAGEAADRLQPDVALQVSNCSVHAMCAPVCSTSACIEQETPVESTLHAALGAVQQGMDI